MSENNQGQNSPQMKRVKPEFWKVFTIETFLFSLTLFLGVMTAFRLNKLLEIQRVSLPPVSFWRFLLYFLLATLLILGISFLPKIKKEKRIIYKLIFIFTASYGSLLCLSLWLPVLLCLILVVVLIFWWVKKPSVIVHDLAMIFGLAGTGAILGLSLSPQPIILLLIIFSIYDFIAVYKTKHMVKMAKEMIGAGTILALIIPSKIPEFKAGLEKIRPGGRFLILGGGDVVFPLLFCASLVPQGLLNSFIVAVFALIGLFFGFYFFIHQKTRRAIPALPPIALFSIIGFLITRIL